MNLEQQAIDTVIKQGLLPLYFHAQEDVCLHLLQVLYTKGIRSIEFTNRGTEALANFRAMVQMKKASMPDMLLGVGTVKHTKDAYAFLDAGADYIISPGFSKEVAEIVHKNKLLYIPGCATATELMTAESAGCRFVKIFPGNILGPSFLSAVKELFPDMIFMPTGGVEVDEANITSWYKAGVKAVGLGSKLISKTAMDQRDYTTIGALTLKAIQIVNQVRNAL